VVPEQKGRINAQELTEIIDQGQFKFFAQSEALPTEGIKVELANDDGLGYVGTIYLGGQPAKVLFDTGSDYLAVTSSLCTDQALGQTSVGFGEPVFDNVAFVYRLSETDAKF
jgi:hypothetical protein